MSAIFEVQKRYTPGDPEPEGYLAWHEWAGIQYKAGLRQKRCKSCGKWKFPQSLNDEGSCTAKCNQWS